MPQLFWEDFARTEKEERRRRGESETRNARRRRAVRQERNGARVAGEGRGARPWVIYTPPNGRIQQSGDPIQRSGEERGGGGALGLWQAGSLSGRRLGCHRVGPIVPCLGPALWARPRVANRARPIWNSMAVFSCPKNLKPKKNSPSHRTYGTCME